MKKKVLFYSQRLVKHELVSGSFYLFIGTIFSAFFAFLLNLFFARSLTKQDYGIYASLIALITLFTIPAQSLTPIIVKFAGDYFAKGEIGKLEKFYFKMTKLVIFLAVVIFILFLIFSSVIKNFLNLDNYLYVPLVGLITSASYVAIVNMGMLQGVLKFFFISMTQILGAFFRILVGVALVFMGFRVFGAIWASFFAFLIAYLIGFIPLRFLFKKSTDVNVVIPTRDLVEYAVPTMIAILSLSSFISMDVILVKHFFPPFQAGLYGGMALVGKVIFYFTGPIPAALFPLLIKRHARNLPFNRLFYLAMFLVFVLAALISAFYFIFPAFTTRFFLGKGYEGIIPYLGLFGVYIGIFSLLNVCVNLLLSLKKTFVFIPILIGSVLQIFLISIFHNNFYQIIYVSIFICGILLISLLSYFILKSGKISSEDVQISISS